MWRWPEHAPARIVEKDAAGAVKHEETWTNTVCARLWGASERDVRDALDASCGTPPADEDICETLFDVQEGEDPGFCAGRAWTDEWLKATPPVSLK